jgi:hypothetical protein
VDKNIRYSIVLAAVAGLMGAVYWGGLLEGRVEALEVRLQVIIEALLPERLKEDGD